MLKQLIAGAQAFYINLMGLLQKNQLGAIAVQMLPMSLHSTTLRRYCQTPFADRGQEFITYLWSEDEDARARGLWEVSCPYHWWILGEEGRKLRAYANAMYS